MASTSGGQAEGEGPNAAIAHLPDASEELGRSADLAITVEGQQLKLHSQVAAAGSRVLRTALCACAGGDSGGAAAAVQAAFEGCKLADVQLFLKMLYNPNGLESRHVTCGTVQKTDSWRGLLSLADKLDAHNVLQACDVYIARQLPAVTAVDRQDHSFATAFGAPTRPTTDWMGWLLLADRLSLNRVAAQCATPLVKKMVEGPVKEDVAQLAQLSQPAMRVLFAVLLKGTAASSGRPSLITANLPPSVNWQAPENLF